MTVTVTSTKSPARSGQTYTVGEVAQWLGRPPKAISDALYRRAIDTARCRVVHGRRQIPADLVPQIQAYLTERQGGREPLTPSEAEGAQTLLTLAMSAETEVTGADHRAYGGISLDDL